VPLDFTANDDVEDLATPLSHAALVRPLNLFSVKRNPPTRGLTKQADAEPVGFFRGNAGSRNGLWVRVSLSPMSLRVARDIRGRRHGAGSGRQTAQTLGCLCRADSFGLRGVSSPLAGPNLPLRPGRRK
jgi:hypothetical protein